MSCSFGTQQSFFLPDFQKQFPFFEDNERLVTSAGSATFNFDFRKHDDRTIDEVLDDLEMVVSSKYNSNFEIMTTAVDDDNDRVMQLFDRPNEPLIMVEQNLKGLRYLIVLPKDQNSEYYELRDKVLDCFEGNHFFNVVISLDWFSLQTKEDYHWRVKLPLIPVQHSITRQLSLSKTCDLKELTHWVSEEFLELASKMRNYEVPEYRMFQAYACA